MIKRILLGLLAIALAFVAYLFWQASNSAQIDLVMEYRLEEARKNTGADTGTGEGVFTMAFGSCNREDLPQDYWNLIADQQPDLWLWLGDNVYADTDDMNEMAAAYAKQKQAPAYAAFTASVPVYGIWDDHDYGINDGGKEWPHKAAARDLMLDFLEVPATAPVRKREGGYQSYLVGNDALSVNLILLDTRYFRDELMPPTRKGDRYGANAQGDVLGEAQWAWLEETLTNSSADAHVIGSSIQVLPEDHGYEKWANFPAARERLLQLLARTQPSLPLILSGDRHLAEVSKVMVDDYAVYEITASGLTHSYEGADEPNRHRISPLIGQKNFGLLHFVGRGENLQLLGEVRSVENNQLYASLALDASGGEMNKEALAAIVHQKSSMTTSLKPCPKSPNCVSTQSTQADKKREPIPYMGTMEEAKARLKTVIAGMPRTKLVKEEGNYLHFTFKTFPIPFIDDVEFIFDDEAKVIHFRSASRVGHSDLGVNSKRMKKVARAYADAE
ncbi:DUF1499 domain-containing protein [Lewinella sp. W8]|uniref:DUF1499 domain-containing protein n=1 Tax=Lewinella sp. W8 TaxID=2528208 RepID=UPI001067F0F6|nr:DUF1499 domain-containing protein [Lewinella sp. W8]MTB50714.1 DUF1499 domain-containing protein [Lewinella sp. W8]